MNDLIGEDGLRNVVDLLVRLVESAGEIVIFAGAAIAFLRFVVAAVRDRDAARFVRIVCLAGISSGRRTIDIDAAAPNRQIVLENDFVFGTVNANRCHYTAAVDALAAADRRWLRRLITRRVPLDRWQDALVAQDDVKVVIEVQS